MLFEIWCDTPEMIQGGLGVYVGAQHEPYSVSDVREKPPFLLVSLKNVTDQDQAAEFRNAHVFVRARDLPPLPPDQFYAHQLIGFDVADEQNRPFGTLVDILETGANDVYVVRSPEGHELLFPATDEVIVSIDLEAGRIVVHPIPGLLSEER
jgi:16S rRNA processing protein RimM